MSDVVNILYCCWETIGLLLLIPQTEIVDNLQNLKFKIYFFLSSA